MKCYCNTHTRFCTDFMSNYKEEYKVKHHLFPCRMGYNSRNAYTQTDTNTCREMHTNMQYTHITHAFMI